MNYLKIECELAVKLFEYFFCLVSLIVMIVHKISVHLIPTSIPQSSKGG